MIQKRIQFSVAFSLLFSVLPSKAQSPTINTQPQSQTVIAGSNVGFSVSASGAGTPVLPQVNSGTLRLWLKADSGVITSSNRVTQWQDQSLSQNHASQPNVNLQPLLVNNAVPISGKPVIRFDGLQTASTGDFLQGTGDVAIATDYTSFLVYSRADRIVQEQVVALVGAPAYDSVRSYYIRSGFNPIDNEMAFSAWGNDYGTGFSIPSDSFRIWTDRMNETKTLLEFFDTDGNNSFNSASASRSLAAPSAGYYVGGLGALTRNFQGDVAELIFYQGSLTENDRSAVENYLKLKYFQAAVPGAGALTYQWQFNGTNRAGATDSSLMITNAQLQDAGVYSVVISNNFGVTISSNAILAVSVPPSIATQPQSQSVLAGTNVSFSVSVNGSSPFGFQWSFNGSTIAGATNSSYSLGNVQETNAGVYSVMITNAVGFAQSDTASLDILVPPSIAFQPQSQSVAAGTNVTFSVTAEAVLPTVLSGNLRLWLKADQDVILSNGRVTEWRDQSGNGNHAFQSDANKQPLFVSSAVPASSRPTVRFDGIQDVSVGDWMNGTNNVDIPTGYTSFLVYLRANRTIPEQAAVGIGIPAQQGALRSYFIRNSGEMALSGWNEDFGTGFDIPADTYRIWTDRLNDTKTTLEFFDITATNTTLFSHIAHGLAVPNAGYYLGGLDAYTRNFQGDISELIVYQGALTDSDRTSVESYLKTKYFFALGGNGLSYQWMFNGTNIAGATNISLTLSNVQLSDAGNYSVAITNLAGSVTSSNALLTVNIPPSINTHPQSQEVIQGMDVSFNVSASDASPLSYQWRFDGNTISNATDSSFSITNAQPNHAGAYSVIVSDGISSVLSSNATLTVNFAPSILGQPQSQTAFTGTNVTLSVTASGYPLNYQWYFNSTNVIAGATNASLVLTNIETGDAGDYSVEVTNPLGLETSSNAVLTVINTASAIFEDFEPGIHGVQWIAFGGTVLATNYGGFVSPAHSLWFGGNGSRYATTRPIDVSSGASISFQLRLASNGSNASPVWEHVDIPNEGIVLEYSLDGRLWANMGVYNTSAFWNWTSVQLAVPPGAQSTGTLFRWRQLSNSGPSADHWALDDVQILPATSAPSIIAQPENLLARVGTNVTLNVVVTGQSPLTYQWVLNSTTILPSTGSSLTLTNVQLADSGDYSVVITNSFGSVTSATAAVTVLMPPSISSQPQSQSGVQGTNISFSVTASGSALNYQWQFNGAAISNAVDSILLLTNIQGSDAGNYSVRVVNSVGSIVSSNASLTIDTFPVIAKQPESQSVLMGTNVTFSVTAEGVLPVLPDVLSGNLRLWLKADQGVMTEDGRVSEWHDQSPNENHAFQLNTNKQPLFVNSAVPQSGQPTIRFDGIQNGNSGDWMSGTDSVGIPTGYTSFLVYLRADRTITEQVAAAVGIPAQSGALRSHFIRNSGEMAFSGWSYDYGTAFNIPANSYRIWTDRLNDARNLLEFFDITETNTTSFSRNTVGLKAPGAGYYIGGLNTYTRNFKGDISEIVIYQGALSDTDRTAVEDYLKQKYFATVSASGELAYQWLFNGTNIVGATNSSITLTNVQALDAGNYSVVVSNSAGAITSGNAELTVNVPPSVTTHPQDQPVNAGGTASFTVTVAGTEPFSYQWQKNSNNLANATNSTLVLNSVQTSDAGNYRVIVTSPFGSDTSSNAPLSVNITTVRVVTTNATSASSFTLPIEISALGTENAVGFSLSFDPSILTFDSVALDNGLNGAILISNTAQLGGGKLGVAVALSADSTFVAGTQALVQVTFNVAVANNALNTAVNFIDLPTERQVSDAGAEILPAVFIDGTVAIAAVDFEGDVTPRPNGNRTLSITDWVQVGRFAAGLDTPAAGEFRRADCAPRDDLGNGSISITDWVQAGRYATGIDPLTPVGGPSAPAFSARGSALTKSSEAPRSVVLETTNKVGQTHTVSARLIAQGNENAIGFSLAFDPVVLTFTGATAGGNASGALLNVNSNSLAAGRVGVALSLTPGNIFAVGTQEVIKLTFTSAVGATGSTSLTFTSVPISCEVSDTTANALVANFANATLVISVPGPLLTINMSEAGAILSWPSSASNFVLETSSAIGAEWTSADGNVVTNEQSISTTLPISEQPQFYRLKQK